VIRFAVAVLIGSGCTLYEPCETSIEYDDDPVPMSDSTCPSLTFEGMPIPVQWYPADTGAFVRECRDNKTFARLFSCNGNTAWSESGAFGGY